MNLEDFKSFRRVLKPPEVGSIPTHSRHLCGALCAGVLAVAAAAPAPAGAADDIPRPSALNRALRSAVVPAWGQVTNGKEKKAAILAGVQAYVWTRVVMESRKGRESERRAARLTEEGAAAGAIAAAEASAENHFDTRRDMVFWAILSSFYGALDAYVDTHLGDFEEDLEEGRELFAGVDPAGRVELGIRF